MAGSTVAPGLTRLLTAAREPTLAPDELESLSAVARSALEGVRYADFDAADREAFETLIHADTMKVLFAAPARAPDAAVKQRARGALQLLFVTVAESAPEHCRALCAALEACSGDTPTPVTATTDARLLVLVSAFLARVVAASEPLLTDEDLCLLLKSLYDFICMVDRYRLDYEHGSDTGESDTDEIIAENAARALRRDKMFLAVYRELLDLAPLHLHTPPVRTEIFILLRRSVFNPPRDSLLELHRDAATRIIPLLRDAPITRMDANAIQCLGGVTRGAPGVAMPLGAVELMQEWWDALTRGQLVAEEREVRRLNFDLLQTLPRLAEYDPVETLQRSGLEFGRSLAERYMHPLHYVTVCTLCLADPLSAPAARARLTQVEVFPFLFRAMEPGATAKPTTVQTAVRRLVRELLDDAPVTPLKKSRK